MLGYHGTAKAIAFSSSVVLYLALWRVGLKRARRKSLRWHAPYSPRVAWVWANVWVPPPTRSRVTPFLAPMGLLLTIGAPFAAWSLPFGSDHEDLGHIVGLTWGAVGSGVVALFVALFALRRRVPARLATRRPGHQQPERVPTTAAAAVLITQVVLEVAICAGQRAGVIPGMFCLLLAGEGLCVGPAMIAFAVAARRSERLLGLDVTLRDCEQAILGSGAVIAPELGQWVTVPRLAPIEGPQLQ